MLSPRIEQQGAGRVVQSFLLDQRGQLGVANIGALGHVAVRVVVVQDGERDDAADRASCAIADDAAIERAVTVRASIGSCQACRSCAVT